MKKLFAFLLLVLLPTLSFAQTNNLNILDHGQSVGSVTFSGSLPAGTNAIGTVGVTSLPALAAGSNAIGTVGVTALPALPTGANTIGTVNIGGSLPAGANALGSVTIGGSLPTGSNTIGTVNISGGTISAVPADVALTDGSGTITTGGTSQQIFAANSTRNYLFVQNLSSADEYINFGSAATTGAGSIKLISGASFVMESNTITNQTVNIIGATTGQSFTAKQH